MTKERISGGETADLTTLLDRNRSFAEQFAAGDLKILPRMSTILLTCVDARVDPAHLFGLGLGDAVVIRNAGGRITPAVMRDLGILSVLAAAANQPVTSPMQPELVVIHHTDCGNVSSRQPGHPGTGGKTARPQCRRSISNGDQRPYHVCARGRRATPSHPRNARPTGRFRLRLRRKQRDDQPSCATGPTPRLLNPRLNPDGSVGKTRNLVA